MKTTVKLRGDVEAVYLGCTASVDHETDELSIVQVGDDTVVETHSELTWQSVTIDNDG